jgi:hypothetical protein
MEAAIEPKPEEPPSERTQAILAMQSQLQNVTNEVREIRRLLAKGETRWTALWRAITQFVGDLKNGDRPQAGDGADRRTPPHIS